MPILWHPIFPKVLRGPERQLIANFEILKFLYLIVHSDLATRTDLERDFADWDIPLEAPDSIQYWSRTLALTSGGALPANANAGKAITNNPSVLN